MDMKTRIVIALGRAAALTAMLMLAGVANAADVTLRFSSAAPPSDFLAKSIEAFKAVVEKLNVGIKVESLSGVDLVQAGNRSARPAAR